ncbi:MAG TPA: hypothetical protein DD452_02115 [Nitrospina sp.]|jgi:hypothetical protein|nr:hypothetical protein [Nitrospinaceae bacterium]HBP10712.1 hypothetical protein [Nitrospina sp.]HCK68607.1 hypothetical protein [Nitrospina sp.]|tara:strand:+ start:943 stop:1131 length:189 start_codon:yes stop_codon:yes gene_type:complete
MAARQKRPKMVFRKFLESNKENLEKFANRKGEKYTREPWMLNANPAAEWTVEILIESEQADH